MKNRVETFNPPILREGGGRGKRGIETSTPTPFHTKDLWGKRKRGQKTPVTGNYSITNCYPETVVLPLCPTTKIPTKLTLLHAPPEKPSLHSFHKILQTLGQKNESSKLALPLSLAIILEMG